MLTMYIFLILVGNSNKRFVSNYSFVIVDVLHSSPTQVDAPLVNPSCVLFFNPSGGPIQVQNEFIHILLL